MREHEGHKAVQPISESSVTSMTFDKVDNDQTVKVDGATVSFSGTGYAVMTHQCSQLRQLQHKGWPWKAGQGEKASKTPGPR